MHKAPNNFTTAEKEVNESQVLFIAFSFEKQAFSNQGIKLFS